MLSARTISALAAAVVACALSAPAAQAAWTVPSGTVASTSSQLGGASCATTTNCILVGSQSGTTTTALASKWNGSTFASLTASSTTSELYGVGCQSTTFCVAVGSNYASGTVTHAESFNGTTWSNMTTPNPAGATASTLNRVACPASNSCFAVGSSSVSGVSSGLIERWNGTTWTVQTLTPPASTTNSELFGISCTSTSACTAVGYYEVAGNPRRTVAYRWNGTSWATQLPANPASHLLSDLRGVSCTTATSCNAVGYYVDSASVQHSLAEVWNGTTWTLKTVADPSGGTDPALYDISCWSTGCEAVGGYSGASTIEPLAAGWNGTVWALQTVPKGSGYTDASLAGVSCASSTSCFAVGTAIGLSGLRPAVNVGP
jgi:hypothetical protein